MEKLTASRAFEMFSKKLKKYQESNQENPVEAKSSGSELQQQIREREELRKKSILRNYMSYKNPVSKSVEEDQKNLLEVLDLYGNIVQLQNTATVAHVLFESPLCHRDCYTQGTQFIYLLCWLLLEKKSPLLPRLVKQNNSKWLLEVIPAEDFPFNAEEKEILAVLTVSSHLDNSK